MKIILIGLCIFLLVGCESEDNTIELSGTTDSFIDLTNGDLGNFGYDDFTISLDFKTIPTESTQVIISKANWESSTFDGWYLMIHTESTPNRIEFLIRDGKSQDKRAFIEKDFKDDWHNVIIERKDMKLTLTLDKINNTTTTILDLNSTARLLLGRLDIPQYAQCPSEVKYEQRCFKGQIKNLIINGIEI